LKARAQVLSNNRFHATERLNPSKGGRIGNRNIRKVDLNNEVLEREIQETVPLSPLREDNSLIENAYLGVSDSISTDDYLISKDINKPKISKEPDLDCATNALQVDKLLLSESKVTSKIDMNMDAKKRNREKTKKVFNITFSCFPFHF
jgi:hypothetical protein